MFPKLLRVLQVLTLIAAVVLGAFFYNANYGQPRSTFVDMRRLPKEGYAENDTHGEVPGDMENGVRGLRKFYRVLQTFRARNNGRYPTSNREIIMDCYKTPQAYHVSDPKELIISLNNPDNKYGDHSYFKPNQMMMYSPIGTRPDGVPVGGPKPAGSPDLVGLTSLYVHENIRLYPHEKSTSNPVGAYLLLWDDGTVTKLPYDQILYTETGTNSWTRTYPGQIGLPKTGILTYDQFYQHSGWKSGPRGRPGGAGVSYND